MKLIACRHVLLRDCGFSSIGRKCFWLWQLLLLFPLSRVLFRPLLELGKLGWWGNGVFHAKVSFFVVRSTLTYEAFFTWHIIPYWTAQQSWGMLWIVVIICGESVNSCEIVMEICENGVKLWISCKKVVWSCTKLWELY